MKIAYLPLIFLLSLFLIPTVLGATIFTEDFEYDDTFSTNGWTQVGFTGCGVGQACQPRPADINLSGSLGFGPNGSITADINPTIHQAFPTGTLTEGLVTISYDIRVENLQPATKIQHAYQFGNTSNSNHFSLTIDETDGVDVSTIDGESCSLTDIGFSESGIFEVEMNIDLTNDRYTVSVNGTSNGCENKILGSMNMAGVRLFYQTDGPQNVTHGIDNIVVESLATSLQLNQTPVGTSCETASDCVTQKCSQIGNICVYKNRGESCESGDECSSGTCLNNQCTKPSLLGGIEVGVEETFGADDETFNVIAIILIIGCVLAIVIFGRSLPAVILGIAVGFVLMFFFTFIGWLSPWLLVGALIIGLLLLVFFMMMGPGTG